jgi:hypothetical protein
VLSVDREDLPAACSLHFLQYSNAKRIDIVWCAGGVGGRQHSIISDHRFKDSSTYRRSKASNEYSEKGMEFLLLLTSFCFLAKPIIMGICSFRWLMIYACTLQMRTRFTNSLILRTALQKNGKEGKAKHSKAR